MNLKGLLPRLAGAAALGAIVLGSVGFANTHSTPQSRLATTYHDTPHVLNYPNIDPKALWPKTFDPANVTDSQSIMVLQMLYGNLVRLNSKNQVIPDLADHWSVNKRGNIFTFHLRDTKFSDGKPVTADDVIYSITRALDPHVYKTSSGKSGPSPVASLYLGNIVGALDYNNGKAKSVKGLKKIDSRTVQIEVQTLNKNGQPDPNGKPISFFLQTLTYPTAYILEKGKTPLYSLTTNNPKAHQISSGPFMISDYTYKSRLVFVPNPGYYNYKNMKLKRVEMPFVPDVDTSYSGYESGQYAMAQVPDNRLVVARHMNDFHSTPLLSIDYISFNFAKLPFSNKAMRLAMSYAINRDKINNQVLHGAQKTIYSVVPEGIPGYDADAKNLVPHYDLNKARAYLAQAKRELGKNFPSSLTIRFQNSSADIIHEYTELQAEWKAIGVNVKLQPVDFDSWLNLVAKPSGNEPWVENLWIDDYPDAQDFTTNLLDPSSAYNIGNYNNPKFNALCNEALTATGSHRIELYKQASRIALNDVAWAMIGQTVYSWRWHNNIKGMTLWSSTANPEPIDYDWTKVDVQ